MSLIPAILTILNGKNLGGVSYTDAATNQVVVQSAVISDPVANIIANVKGASVAPALADSAAVVTLRPETGGFQVNAAALPLPANASQDGTDATGVTAPTGGVGIRGWLSGVYSLLKGTISTSQAGSSGFDFSVNKPTLPNIGAGFGGSGPYAGYVLIATVPANPARLNIDVENTSGAQVVVVRDDGTAAGGQAPVQASVFALGGGSGAGAQGGGWASRTFKGRLQIYAASSAAQVAILAD